MKPKLLHILGIEATLWETWKKEVRGLYIQKNIEALPQDIIVKLGGSDIIRSINVDLRTFSDQIKMIENRVNSCDYNLCITKNDIGVLKSDMKYIKSQYVTLENVLNKQLNEQTAMNLKMLNEQKAMNLKMDAILNAFNPNDVNIEMNTEDALCDFQPDKKKMRIAVSTNYVINNINLIICTQPKLGNCSYNNRVLLKNLTSCHGNHSKKN